MLHSESTKCWNEGILSTEQYYASHLRRNACESPYFQAQAETSWEAPNEEDVLDYNRLIFLLHSLKLLFIYLLFLKIMYIYFGE